MALRSRLPRLCASLLLVVGATVPAWAQLPPDAVDLSLVKIPEKLKSVDIDPVTLKPSAADGATWTYGGVAYRAGDAGSKEKFLSDPDQFARTAAKERWVENFMLAMSTIWCPITDEVTPGGRKQVDGLGLKWESCCSFCDDEMRPENFGDAIKRLRERGEKAYELTDGLYVNDASSPVEGAIKADL